MSLTTYFFSLCHTFSFKPFHQKSFKGDDLPLTSPLLLFIFSSFFLFGFGLFKISAANGHLVLLKPT